MAAFSACGLEEAAVLGNEDGDMVNEREAEVVIIGGGVMGASIAYYLSKKGRQVLLVEGGSLCSGTSGSTAGWLWIQDKRPDHYMRLTWSSLQRYSTLQEELESDFEYRITGGMDLLRNQEELDLAHRIAGEQQRAGLDVRVLTRDEALEKEPVVSPHILGALYSSHDGHINPFLLVNSYMKAAKKHGAQVLTLTPVTGFQTKGQEITALNTGEGVIRAGTVICAAGIQSLALGRMLGIEVPVYPQRGFCLVSEPVGKVLNNVVVGARQTVSGNVVFGFTQDRTGNTDRRVPIGGMEWVAKDALRDLPGLAGIRIIRSYAGIRCIPMDRFPIIGPVRQFKNFWLAVSHSSFGLSGALGPMVAELFTVERELSSIPLYAPGRFAGL